MSTVTGVSAGASGSAPEITTAAVLKEMLTERIGTHMLDSGCAYGYNFERNQGKDLDAQPETTVDFRYGYIDITHNIYPWLLERLDYDRELDALFHTWAPEHDPENDMTWLQLMDAFPKHLQKLGRDVGGIYGDGDAFIVNTYNHDSYLSQVIQFLFLEIEGDAYVLLQIHGGCDVRGGYTKPRAFRVPNDGTEIFDDNKASLYCSNHGKSMLEVLQQLPDPNQLALFGEDEVQTDPELLERIEHVWDSDSGYGFHWSGWTKSGPKELSGDIIRQWPDDEDVEIPGTPMTGLLIVDEEGNGYCPICGGKLEAWSR